MRRIANQYLNLLGLLFVSFAISFCGGCRDEAPSAWHDEPDLSGRITIAHLKTLSTALSTPILSDIVIEGYIVANDLYGEYRKSIILCDDSGGIEISVDCDNTAVRFPLSAHVVVQCNSLALGDYGGMLILGAQPSGEFLVDRIAEYDIERYFTIDKQNPRQIEPATITLAELSPRHINNFILLEDVTFGEQAGLSWCERDAETGEFITTERTLWDRNGDSVTLRMLGECSYASEVIPADYGMIAAMVEYFNDRYVLRIINRNILF